MVHLKDFVSVASSSVEISQLHFTVLTYTQETIIIILLYLMTLNQRITYLNLIAVYSSRWASVSVEMEMYSRGVCRDKMSVEMEMLSRGECRDKLSALV